MSYRVSNVSFPYLPRPMRKLTDKEITIISRLLSEEPGLLGEFNLHRHDIWVEEMNDGGMGSLSFINPNKAGRVFGGRVGREELQDEDGIPILISMYLDQDGELFELDVWKVDFSPVSNIVVDRFAAGLSLNELYALNGGKSSPKSCQQLRTEFPELDLDWLIAAMLEFPLAGCNLVLDSIDFDMQWMKVETMLAEARDFYPGMAAIKHGYFPVGTCLYGSGNPYFVNLKEPDKAIVQIPHDAINNEMQLVVEKVEVIFPRLVDLFEQAQLFSD